MKTLLIDNYDSYSHILWHYIWKITGEKPIIIKNDELSLWDIQRLDFERIVISPGPGRPDTPQDFGVCGEVIQFFQATPILGVCLGHQGIGYLAGGRIVHAPQVRHGKYSRILHDGSTIFKDIPNGFMAVRYHSLVIRPDSVPPEIKILATAEDDGQIMAITHNLRPHFGVQFHPESIGTEFGETLMRNFLTNPHRHTQVRKAKHSHVTSTYKIHYRETAWKPPEVVFQSLFADLPYSFWLDSGDEEAYGRYSYMGTADKVIEFHGKDTIIRETQGKKRIWSENVQTGDPYDILNQELRRVKISEHMLPVPFKGGLLGYFAYEFGSSMADIPGKSGFPESILFQCLQYIAFDRKLKKIWVCALYRGESSSAEKWVSDTLRSVMLANSQVTIYPDFLPWENKEVDDELLAGFTGYLSREQYLKSIGQIQKFIRDGETYEACFTNEFVKEVNVPPSLIYSTLRQINPAPYSCFLRFPQGAVLSSSPERFLEVNRAGTVLTEPIKGTRPRGDTVEQDLKNREELITSEKDASELLMITDLLRNDLAKVCEPGSVVVKDLKKISEFATVLQLSSVICGKLREDMGLTDLLRASFPGGSITGAPKKRSMEILSRFEGRRRGVYTGCIGYLGFDDTMALNIAIRTIVMEKARLSIGSGGAITSESIPEKEYDEILVKAAAMIRSVKFAQKLHSASGI